MLFNGDVSKESLQKPCRTDFTRESVTKKPQWIFNCKEGLVTGDTVGFGDPSMSDYDVAVELKRFVAILRNGVHGIILVTRFGRSPSREEQATVKALMRVFGPSSRFYEHMILVVAHYDGEDSFEAKQKAIDTWIGDDSEMRTLVDKLDDRVILTDNNTNSRYEETTRTLRTQCLESLKMFIQFRCDELLECRMKPSSILQDVVKPLLRFRSRSGEIISHYESSKIKSACCSICGKEIDLSNLAFTKCHHCFHKDCIQKSYKTKTTCPESECDTSLTVIYTPDVSARRTDDGEKIYVRRTSGANWIRCAIL